MNQQKRDPLLEKLTQGAIKPIFDGIIFSFSSLEDFDDESTMRSILKVILNAPGVLAPKKLILNDSSHSISELDALFCNFINCDNTTAPSSELKRVSGALQLQHRQGCKYTIIWYKKKTEPVFQYLSGHIDTSVLQKDSQRLPQFLEVVKQLIPIVKPVHGSVRYMMIEGWNIPLDLRMRLPDIVAINIYGKPYVEMFGKNLIESAPFERIEEVTDNYYWLEANRSVFDPVSEEKKRSIREHFGEDAFMSGGQWRYESGRAPNFDFSKVTPDSF